MDNFSYQNGLLQMLKGTLEIVGRGYFAPQTRASDRLEIIDLLNPQITSVHIALSLDPVLPTIRILQNTHAQKKANPR